MSKEEEEDQLLSSVALKNSVSIHKARQKSKRELLEAKEALHESTDRLTNILKSITDGFVVFDSEWRISYLNQRAEALLKPLKKSRETLLGKIFWDEFPDVVDTVVEENYRRAVREQVTVEFEYFYPALNTWFEIRAYPSKNGLSLYFQDIGQRKRVEDALRVSETFLRAIFDQAAVGIAVAGPDARFLEMNDKFCSILGYSRAELLQMTFTDIIHPDDLPQSKDNVRRLMTSDIKDYSHEKRYIRKDGAQIWSLTKVTLQKDATGQRSDSSV